MSHVTPHNAKNSMKNVAFAFEFKEPLPQATVKEAIEYYKKDSTLTQELPRIQPIESMTFNMGGQGTNSPVKTLAGVIFDKLMPNGEQEWSVIIRPDAFIVICGTYDSWTNVFEKTFYYIRKMSQTLENIEFSTIGLEFNDEFVIDNIETNSWLPELFNLDSKFLTKDLIQKKGSWHLHSGYWNTEHDDQYVSHCLVNSNIDCVIDESINKNLLKIKHMQKCHLLSPLIFSQEDALEKSSVIFEKAHDVNFNFISDLLSDDMKKIINMEVKS